MSERDARYLDEWGQRLGFCNSCGEETRLDWECCEDGEVVAYGDDKNTDEAAE